MDIRGVLLHGFSHNLEISQQHAVWWCGLHQHLVYKIAHWTEFTYEARIETTVLIRSHKKTHDVEPYKSEDDPWPIVKKEGE